MKASAVALLTSTALLITLPAVPASAVQPEGYGHNDGGGFRNILPPGSDGVDTLADFQRFVADGTTPDHWDDQQPLYEGLLSAAPSLRNRDIADYFKDATFGVRPRDRGTTERPRSGVTIIRDKKWGVPRIYGKTRRDTTFGAGYAGAADRLFLMDVLRHTGRATLSSFLGGGNLASDENQWRFAAYTDADLRKQIRLTAAEPGGKQVAREVRSYVAGINAYIAEARRDSDKMPTEYALLGQELRDWKVTDVVATASLVGGIFGKGGGGSVESAQVYTALAERFGAKRAQRIWTGFRSREYPGAPVTVKQRFPYLTGDSFAKPGLAIPRNGSVRPAQVVSGDGVSAQGTAAGGTGSFGDEVVAQRADAHASNWELVNRRHSANGRPIAVMGPQVGYWLPQILVEQELHGPGLDARGVAFAGVNLYVQMGHGRDYAWSATSAGSDNVDVFAEVLCGGSRTKYRYRGKCRPMEKLVRRNSWTPNAIDPTPAGSAKLTVYRTVHGLVQSYGRVDGKRVAFAVARTTYMRETQSAIGFAALNNPNKVRSAETFQRAADGITFTFNWAYADHRDIAYYLSGAYPVRAPGTSPDFPLLGTGKYDWRGWNPRTWSSRTLPFTAHPQVINPDRLVSWNNKVATGWGAADEQWGYGPIYRSQLIDDRIRRAIAGGGTMTRAELVQAMALPATQDIRGVKLLPLLLRAVGRPGGELGGAVRELRRWQRDGSYRRDLDGDGAYKHNAAIQIMDAWWPRLVAAQFRRGLGTTSYEAIQAVIGLGAVTEDRNPGAPGFADGWWGYVDRDLRTVLGRATGPSLGREFCGSGDRDKCRAALRGALREALTVTPAQLYGTGACADDPQASCFDRNRYRVTSAISRPSSFPFQNRPTFQQVVSVLRQVPRGTPGRG